MLYLKSMIVELHEYNVSYILFGSLAAIAYGANFKTNDMDMCFATTEENMRNIGKFLTAHHARPVYAPGWNTLEEVNSWQPEPLTPENFDHQFETDLGLIDVVPAPFGPNGDKDRFDYNQLLPRATTFHPFDIPVQVAHIDDVIASKMSRRRKKDVSVEIELERIRKLVNEGVVLAGLERYVTIEK